jgi:hypothetical protein
VLAAAAAAAQAAARVELNTAAAAPAAAAAALLLHEQTPLQPLMMRRIEGFPSLSIVGYCIQYTFVG